MFKNLNASLLGISGHESEIIELALTYGFGGMDLEILEFTSRVSKRGMEFARRLIDSAGIRMGAFDLPLKWDVEDDVFQAQLAQLPEFAEVAKEVECTRCLARIEPGDESRPYHENFEFHRARLGEVCRVLEPSGIRLGIGFRAADDLRKGKVFQFIHDLDATSLLINMVDAWNLGLFLDIWDLHVAGGSPESLRSFKGQEIVAVHVADLPEDAPADEVTEASRSLPGPEGRIDVSAYLLTLAELGYDGPITPAPAGSTLGSSCRDPIVKQAGEALSTAWKAAGLTPEGKPPVAAEAE